MNYDEVANEVFFKDGSLRDIYILDTDIQVWALIFEYLESNEINYRVTIDGLITRIRDIAELLRIKKEACIGITIEYSEIDICGHLYEGSVIEFDISPIQIDSEKKIDILMNFLKSLSRKLNKTIIITPEMTTEEVLVGVEP
ncbi:protein export chaperone secb [Paenibacillus polymyxa]|uniref:protein export chaperone secb n=1 Tax=Paenibacillus polymyxa TaxID=1406 RepID=UPI000C9EFBF1|nr:protein export chaperone secb [Paenibacillus polymyxa]MDU8672242.1 protein export chaperone secb [Paenibacillus polymyxa]MDU8697151.1 protein export chaperone secb [Paenibacillus polymyxa]PNQ84091.1 protein export chaperone secb [Paenibacillus polymyxa]QDA28377.1 protein export chaperone secb [Paenibacillus polymyxa]RTZ37063.1 protein export chaperone secb [Paenibacillus polymyxa]